MKKILALTGMIGSGKSVVATMLEKRGATIIDADELSRQVMAPNSPCTQAIRSHFGDEVFHPDGSIDRKKLGGIVFADGEKRRSLEALTHPPIEAAYREAVKSAQMGDSPFIVYVIPLLAEKPERAKEFDRVILVTTPKETALARIMSRNNLTYEQAISRYEAHAPEEEKRKLATDIIENDGSLAELDEKVQGVWEKVVGRQFVK